MKKSILLVATLLMFIISCNNSNKESAEIMNTHENQLSIKGTWERVSYYNYDNEGGITDSFATSEANKHIKIFTDSKVMWCRHIAADSTEWFGYGNYTLNDSILTEVLEYGSKRMSKFISQEPTFIFKYTLDKNKYSQIQIDEEGHLLFAENYVRLE